MHSIVIFAVFMGTVTAVSCVPTEFHIGTGIYDITGPAAEVSMMGYGSFTQKVKGIHFRLRSRAFIIADKKKANRIVFVNADICMADQIIKLEVIKKLKAKYGQLYTEKNVCISSTHTHSGPGGYLQYVLYQITSLGFIKQSMNAIVNGIVKSIDAAHYRMKPGNIHVNEGELLNSNINRSPTAYLRNPASERSQYQHNVDKEMVLLKMTDSAGRGIGMINWFGVHGTSMKNTNGLISGDNKGYASYLFEKEMNGPNSFPGKGPFIAAFAQGIEGDVTPNVVGDFCSDTGKSCYSNHSSCNGDSSKCHGKGPGRNMFESTKIIGARQFDKARQLYNTATRKLSGTVDSRHQYVDMTDMKVTLSNGKTISTCKPAMGFSFAAGTTDGPGDKRFIQGTTKLTKFWQRAIKTLQNPSKQQIACHRPKPILLNTGEMKIPYRWQPFVVDTQMLRIGNFVIAPVPAEFTTMAGRRLRNAIRNNVMKKFGSDTKVVIAGLSNTYAGYVTTYEEYQAQRYEGASTYYGPNTLTAYICKYLGLSDGLLQGTAVTSIDKPVNLLSKQISLMPRVYFDATPWGKKFGQVKKNAHNSYFVGATVEVTFHSGNPRNNLQTEGTFLQVEKLDKNDKWTVVLDDSDWSTRFYWYKTSIINPVSTAKITWTIASGTPAGTYRIRHIGHYKSVFGRIKKFSGTSCCFHVRAK